MQDDKFIKADASGSEMLRARPGANAFNYGRPVQVEGVLDFDGATDEHSDWLVTIPSQYLGTTGFTWSYKYATDGADPDFVEIELRILHIDDLDVLTANLGLDSQTANFIQDTPPATPTDKFSYTATDAIPKADFGSAVAGDFLAIRATRDESAVENVDDLQLAAIYITET